MVLSTLRRSSSNLVGSLPKLLTGQGSQHQQEWNAWPTIFYCPSHGGKMTKCWTSHQLEDIVREAGMDSVVLTSDLTLSCVRQAVPSDHYRLTHTSNSVGDTKRWPFKSCDQAGLIHCRALPLNERENRSCQIERLILPGEQYNRQLVASQLPVANSLQK